MRRIFGVAFLADFQLYLLYTALPFKALQLGAGAFELGLLAAISTGSYAILVALFGRLSDRFPRATLARLSSFGFIAGCIAFTSATELKTLFMFAPLAGGSMAPFWPNVQASVADLAGRGRLETQLGRFNLCWSSGKGAGFLIGGVLVATWGVGGTFTVATAVAFAIFFLLPRELPKAGDDDARALHADSTSSPRAMAELTGLAAGAPERDASVDDSKPGHHLDPDVRAPVFRRMGWIANAVAFGVSAALNHHYPRVVQDLGWGAGTFGLFLGLTYLTQTVTFAMLMLRPQAWCFKRAPLYVTQALVLAAVLALPFADHARLIVAAFVVGVGLGTCYYSSIVYSLHAEDGRGRNAGVHEGLIGVGSMLVPFAGGVAARMLEVSWAPFAVAAVAIALSLVAQEMLYNTARRRTPV